MKHTLVALSTLVAAAHSLKPVFSNSQYDVQRNEKFDLKWNAGACPSGCSIYVVEGAAGNLKRVGNVAVKTEENASSAQVELPQDLGNGEYAFEISNGVDESNYSPKYNLEGGPASASSSSAISSTPEATRTSSDRSDSTESSTRSGTTTSTDSESSTPTATEESTTVSRNQTTSVASRRPARETSLPGNVPSSGVDRVSASLAFIAAVVAAMAYIN